MKNLSEAIFSQRPSFRRIGCWELAGNQWRRQTSEAANSIFETRSSSGNVWWLTVSAKHVRRLAVRAHRDTDIANGTTDGERARPELAEEVIRFARERWAWRSISVYNVSLSLLPSAIQPRSFLRCYTLFPSIFAYNVLVHAYARAPSTTMTTFAPSSQILHSSLAILPVRSKPERRAHGIETDKRRG